MDITSRESFRKALELLYEEERVRDRGSLRTILVYPHLEVAKIPRLVDWRSALRHFIVSNPKQLDQDFYQVNLELENRTETFYLDTGMEGIWLIHFFSAETLERNLTQRLINHAHPFLTRVRISSSELLKTLDKLQEKYSVRPTINKVVAKQFFDRKSENATTTYRKRTLVLYQEDCEATIRVLRDTFPVFPDNIRIIVKIQTGEILYTASLSRKGSVRLFSGPRVRHFLDDVGEFVAVPAVKRLSDFKEREPRKVKGFFESKPIQIEVGPNLHLALPALRENLLHDYACVTYHAGNPYLDMMVVEPSSASEFRLIASGDSIVVVPTKYESPSSLLKLTRTIMETVGGEGEQDFERAEA
jgi:hypothetical protein